MRSVPLEQLALAAILALVVIALIVRAIRGLAAGRVTVYEYQVGVRFQHGRIVGILGPGGYTRLWPGTLIHIEDVRERQITLPGQEMLTSDALSVRVSLVARVRIRDVVKMLTATQDASSDIYADLQVALRKAVVGRTLEAVLADRDSLGGEVMPAIAARATARGMEIIEIEVRDVMVSGEAKRAYADIFRAKKEGEAALERARGETAALRNLANGARLLKDNPHLYQLRLLQTLAMPFGRGATVVLNTGSEPLPPTAVQPPGGAASAPPPETAD